jgi:hypothetical protein
MDKGFKFGRFVNIWDVNKNERLKISIRMCRDPLVVFVYGPYVMENCKVVLIEVANEDYE